METYQDLELKYTKEKIAKSLELDKFCTLSLSNPCGEINIKSDGFITTKTADIATYKDVCAGFDTTHPYPPSLISHKKRPTITLMEKQSAIRDSISQYLNILSTLQCTEQSNAKQLLLMKTIGMLNKSTSDLEELNKQILNS